MQQPTSRIPARQPAGTRPSEPQAASRLRLLLFPEVCLLAAVAGILAFRHPGPGCVLLFFTWLLDAPRSRPLPRCCCLAAAFLCAFAYAAVRAPVPPPVPDWLHRAAFVSMDEAGNYKTPRPVRVRGRVDSCAPLQGGRFRIMLDKIAPAAQDGAPEPYTGTIVWTWYQPGEPPLAGDTVEADLRLAPQRGFANPGAWDSDQYWHDRGVWFRAWSSGEKTNLAVNPPASPRAGSQDAQEGGSSQRAAALRRELERRFTTALPHDLETGQPTPAASILPALIFGDRSLLTPEQTDRIARSTLAHSLALSGLHLGFAVLAGFVLAEGLGRLLPSLWLRIPRPTLALFCSLPVAGLYLWLGQAPLSLMRAACMLAFWTLLVALKRPRVLLDGLLAALAFLLLMDPFALFDVGLQMSVLSVATIALCLPSITGLARRCTPGKAPGRPGAGRAASLARGALVMLGVSFCIQTALLPITVRIFGTSGLLFPLNLLWLPVLGTVVLPLAFLGLFATALGASQLGEIALHAAALPCEALLRLLEGLDRAGWLLAPLMPRPHWLSSAGFWLLCLCLPGLWAAFHSKRPFRRETGAVMLALCGLAMLLLPVGRALHANSRPGVSLRLLDVGQGQAVLVQWSGLGGERSSGRALVDGGGFAGGRFDVGKAVLAPALTDNAMPRLDIAVASHPDTDHLSGLLFILGNFSVRRYFGNGCRAIPALQEQEDAILREKALPKETLRQGDRLALGPGLELEVLWPPQDVQKEYAAKPPGAEQGNHASLVLRLLWQGRPLALLCADAEGPALRELLKTPSRLAAQVLVLPHHGSAGSVVPGFHAAVSPRLALVSCGYGNRWGFPSRAARRSLEALGIPLRSTAQDGQIQIRWAAPDAAPHISVAREHRPGAAAPEKALRP